MGRELRYMFITLESLTFTNKNSKISHKSQLTLRFNIISNLFTVESGNVLYEDGMFKNIKKKYDRIHNIIEKSPEHEVLSYRSVYHEECYIELLKEIGLTDID
jgi:hypothetical protein